MSALFSPPSMSRIPSTGSSIQTMPPQPHAQEASLARRARAESNSSKPLDAVVESTQRHTWIIPGAISAAILGLWVALDPKDPGNPFRPFIMLSYRVVKGGEVCYGKGGKDLLFCAFYAAFFTFLRELTMEMVLQPLARKTGLSKSKQGRFMEQCYSCLVYTLGGVLGLVCLCQSG
jgi:acyl-CoA-dependent ceramide synthase